MKRKWIRLTFFLFVHALVTIFILSDKHLNPSNVKDSTPLNEADSNPLNVIQNKPSNETNRLKEVVPLPTELHPVVKEQSSQLIQHASKKGIGVVITGGYRSVEEQNLLYEQGRTTEGHIVTNAKGGESYHNYGLAVDFALHTSSGKVIWDRKYDGNKNGRADWTEVAEIAKSLGFEWGGDWEEFQDYPHLQMNYGLTIADLQDGQRPDEAPLTAHTE